jgi:transglutaminase-like putative cysteine protease
MQGFTVPIGTVARVLSLAAMAGLAFCPAMAAQDSPPWLREAAAARPPDYGEEVPAVILLNEQRVTVDEGGRVTTVERGAMRIMRREGRDYAAAAVRYMTDTGKVRDIKAWLIRPSGDVKRYGKDQTIDAAAVENDVYNEVRVKIISAGDEAVPGSVFGYESVAEDRSVFTQFEYQFQERLPVLASRFGVVLPEGWRAEGVTFNHARVEPIVLGSTYVWELRDLPPIKREAASPAVTNIAPRLAVSYYPPEGRSAGIGRTFQNWGDVAKWLSELADPQSVPTPAIEAKAKSLTASAKTELERIAAIARYAQSINYISIQIGIGRGGGYRPRTATDVFAKSYGDCKDKANLMRAMLKAIGVTSYPVVIYSGDPTYVREEWASPQQFNHCIIAVKVSDETQSPAVITHPAHGRLLMFDPTDEYTAVGDLPDHEQGSLALIVASEHGSLVRMPVFPAEANRLERQTELQLEHTGTIVAKVRERSVGQAAVNERRAFRRQARPEYVRFIEQWVSRGASGANVTRVDPLDKDDGQFLLEVEFRAERYGQLMQDRLLVFKPAVVSRRESLFLTEPKRTYPVVLDAQHYTETVTANIPADFAVDELPNAVKLDEPFGKYSAAYEVKGSQLVFRRSLVIQNGIVPPDKYPTVRSFFERVRAAEQAPVVLARK